LYSLSRRTVDSVLLSKNNIKNIIKIWTCIGEIMTSKDVEIMESIAVLKEISNKMDQMNKSLEYLCKCEDAKNEREIQRQKNMHEGLEAMKNMKVPFTSPELPKWTPPTLPKF
jgi:hypothetical protein